MLQALFQKREEKNEWNLFPLGRRSDVSSLFFFLSIYEAAERPSAGWHVQKKKKEREMFMW